MSSNIDDKFSISEGDVVDVSLEDAMQSPVGEVYLVRSPNIRDNEVHMVLITGGLIQKPHGLRPETKEYSAPEANPFSSKPSDNDSQTQLLLLNDSARQRFYESYEVPQEYRRS